MEGLTLSQLAAASGVPEDEVVTLVELGILAPGEDEAPYGPGDVRRVRFALACRDAGLPLEGIGAALREGKLSFAFVDLPSFRWSRRTGRTYADLAHELGVDLGLVQAAQEAMGPPRPRPEDPIREDDADIMASFPATLALVPEHVALRVLRVWAESLLRIARAETQVYHDYYETPLLRSGMSQPDMMQIASEMGNAVVPLMERGLMAMYRRQQEHAWNEDLVEHIEAALEEAGLYRAPERPPAMCFLDLTGYTRLTEERGDRAAAELAARLIEFAQHFSQRHGGRPVKWLGDGVMFHFRDPHGAVVGALEMVDRSPQEGLPPAHVGIHAGPVVQQDGDYFGRTVNLAARIATRATAGEVLVTDSVVAASDGDAVRFTEIGPVELKGVPRPVVVHRAERAGA